MDILDVHIVRIKDHDEETDLTLDTYFAVDAESYPPIPKKMSWLAMVTYIITLIFSHKIYNAKIDLRADEPYDVTFPTPFTGMYAVQISYGHAVEQGGVVITNETLAGLTLTAQGVDTTIDLTCIPLTPVS